jgi:hypothetical protein
MKPGNPKNNISVVNLWKIFLVVFSFSASADLSPFPVPPIASGYGAKGPYRVIVDSIAHPEYDNAFVYFFRPENIVEQCPVIFFCHGIGETNPRAYEALIHHIVSRGQTVIYSPYPAKTAIMNPRAAYSIMWQGFAAAMSSWDRYIDRSRIGFVGHSYGGGAVPAMAHKALVERKWGEKGAFLFIMAPWYSYDISKKQPASFPRHAAMVVTVFADDNSNDHRMAKDLYCSLGIPDSLKSYATLYSDSINGRSLKADHNVPLGRQNGDGVDALDIYGIYRQLDALADFAFVHSQGALREAVGVGAELREMGAWRDGTPVINMTMTKEPEIFRPQSYYRNFWSHAMNPRFRYVDLGEIFTFAWYTPRTLWHYYEHLFGKA